MTQPVPTQSQHPWRASIRTATAATLALLPLLPPILYEFGVAGLPYVAGFITFIGGITRVMAMPGVIEWVRRHAKWLAPDAPSDPTR